MEFHTEYMEMALGATPEDKSKYWYYQGSHLITEGTEKTMQSLELFLINIDIISKKEEVKDERISDSKGDINKFKSQKEIDEAIHFIIANKLQSVKGFKDIINLYELLKKNKEYYMKAYDRNIAIIKLEYENIVYLIVTGLTSILSSEIEIKGFGERLKVIKKCSLATPIAEEGVHSG